MTGQIDEISESKRGMTEASGGKAALVRGHILHSISRGEYRQGQRIPTEKRLVDQLGVSRNTLREALASLVQEGVLHRRQGSGTYVMRTFSPEQQKDRLAEMKVVRIGLVLPKIGQSTPTSSYLQGLVKGMTLSRDGEPAVEVRFLTAESVYRGVAGVHFLDAAQRNTVDALLLTVFELDKAELDEAAATGVPIIFSGLAATRPGFAFVRSDLAAGVTKLTGHLYDIGRKRISLLMDHRCGRTSTAYLSGLVAAMGQRGLSLDLSRVAYFDGDRTRIDEALKSLLDQSADSVVCCDDDVAVEVLRLLQRWKIDVPGQVAVTGANNTAPDTGTAHLPLTTLNIPLEAMGQAVRELAFDAIGRGGLPPKTLIFEPDLIVRDSAPKTFKTVQGVNSDRGNTRSF